jgi:hypothetical protein
MKPGKSVVPNEPGGCFCKTRDNLKLFNFDYQPYE